MNSLSFIICQAPGSAGESIISILIGLVILIVIFLIIRGLVLWYWKVDKIVANQEKTNELLSSILRRINSIEKSKRNKTNEINAEDPAPNQ